MKALVMPAPGGADVLEMQEVADPRMQGERDLRIQLKAAGVNPIDTKLRDRGPYIAAGQPAILGCDGAGVVVEAGRGCTRFRPGDEVFFFNGGIGGATGTYAEQTVVDERWVAAKPPGLSFVGAAALPLAAITAWEALFDHGRLQADEDVLIHAGAGGVGHLAIQLAADAGARVCTTVGSEEKAAFVRELGAEQPIPYKEVDFVDAANAFTEGRGVDLAFDTVGPAVLTASFPAIRFYGRAVTLLEPKGTDFKQARLRNQSIHLELMLSPLYFGLAEARAHQTAILEDIARRAAQGRLHVRIPRVFPLAEGAAAHRLIEEGHMTGKAVLTTD